MFKDIGNIYLDNNATTPVAKEVTEALLPYLTQAYGNPSSSYSLGLEAKAAIEKARGEIAIMLQADSASEIIFQASGSESINFVLKTTAYREKKESGRTHIITSCIEHIAVLATCRYLESQDFSVTYIPVDKYGQVSIQDIIAAITPQTFLISIMHANNEIGTIEPISEIAQSVKDHVKQHQLQRIYLHTDASQSIGKVDVSVKKMQVDFLTIAGHKLYAPKGIGALYIRTGTLPQNAQPYIHGASHERGLRAGTENVPYIVALGKACGLITENLLEYQRNMRTHRNYLRDGLMEQCAKYGIACRVNGHSTYVLPNTLSISFQHVSAVQLLQLIEKEGIFASAGSACHSHKASDTESTSISYVLESIGLSNEFALGTLRLSVGRMTTMAELDRAINAIISCINSLLGHTKNDL